MVKLYPGRTLNDGQVEAVVQMIASSIAMLESSEVKVVDQFGRLLTDDEDEGMAQTTRRFASADRGTRTHRACRFASGFCHRSGKV